METGGVAARWHDLLVSEALALDIVREAGIPAAQTR